MKLEAIRKYIQSVRWKFASTMPEHPHEYTLKEWDMSKIDAFNEFVMHIRENGYKQLFLNKQTTYFDVDDHKYWTMGAPLSETILINRAKL